MLIARSRKYTENSEEMRMRLESEVFTFARKCGIPAGFVMDSKAIQDSIERIASRMADLSESVLLDKTEIELHKKQEEFETAMQGMAKAGRKLRKPKKPLLSKKINKFSKGVK